MENPEIVQSELVNIRTLFKYDTEFCADSVEWCPQEPFHNYFVCANYQLCEGNEDQPCKRLGRILLFSLTPQLGLKLNQTINTAAVLDQKWCHSLINGQTILGVVNAEGTLEIYKLTEDTLQLDKVTSFKFEVSEKEILLLSLDWSTGRCNSNEPDIVCSDSTGSVHLFKFIGDSGELLLKSSFCGHSYEAWIAAFYYWDRNITFSGGDDSILLKYDRRVSNEPVLKNKLHEAGVTCIHSNANREFQIATGSYDENLRIWDIRNMKSTLFTLKMPAPLWRLKWDPHDSKHLLCACMLGGAHVVHVEADTSQIVGSYGEHKNICYGADWSYLGKDEVNRFKCSGNRIIGTCSFYDHLLCISELNLESV